jgi:hypothetical protein
MYYSDIKISIPFDCVLMGSEEYSHLTDAFQDELVSFSSDIKREIFTNIARANFLDCILGEDNDLFELEFYVHDYVYDFVDYLKNGFKEDKVSIIPIKPDDNEFLNAIGAREDIIINAIKNAEQSFSTLYSKRT